jgi:hypothetical protein
VLVPFLFDQRIVLDGDGVPHEIFLMGGNKQNGTVSRDCKNNYLETNNIAIALVLLRAVQTRGWIKCPATGPRQ